MPSRGSWWSNWCCRLSSLTCAVFTRPRFFQQSGTVKEAQKEQADFYQHLRKVLGQRKVWRPLVLVGDCNLDFGNIAGQFVGDFQAPGVDTVTACHLQDILEQFSLFAPATFEDCHQGPRHTHSSELLGARRIDFIFLLAQWRDGVAGSWVDYDMDMLSPNDDHFMPVCDFEGRVYQPVRPEARGARS